MAKCKDIVKFIEEFAPVELAEDWDNVGLMVGNFDSEVGKVLVALDVNDDVIDEALDKNVDMIVTHHPFIFGGLKNINSRTALGRRAIKLIKNDISVYSAHTNLDISKNGTNDTLAGILGLKKIEVLLPSDDNDNGLGRVGELDFGVRFIDFANSLKKKLNLKNIVVSGNKNNIVKKIGLCTGSCSGKEYMLAARNMGCDAYVTGDLKYHEAQFANDLDLCVADVSHYGSEVIIVPVLCDYLNDCSKKSGLDFCCVESEINCQTLNII